MCLRSNIEIIFHTCDFNQRSLHVPKIVLTDSRSRLDVIECLACPTMSTCLEDLPNELFLHLFATYFDGGQSYRTFFSLNARLDRLLKSLDRIHLRLDNTDDDRALELFATKAISVHIGPAHRSVKFSSALKHVRSVTLVDPSVVQIMYLLQIGQHLEHAHVIWSNPHVIDLVSARAFYELIFSAGAVESLRSCRLFLPPGHSSYLEPKHCTLPQLYSLYAQISVPMADFRRLLRLCPNLSRLELEIVDDGYSNSETLIFVGHLEHEHIRQFHVHNLLSLDVLDIYLGSLSRVEQLYISTKLPAHPLDVFKQLARVIHRLNRLRTFRFRVATGGWNLGHQRLELVRNLHPFFAHTRVESDDDEIFFVN